MKSNLLNGVLDNFLGTYTSRYSDYEGFWLFALMAEKLDGLQVDLLGKNKARSDDLHVNAAYSIAVQKFHEQMKKSGLTADDVQEARLKVSKIREPTTGLVKGRMCVGWMFRFMAIAKGATGAGYEKDRMIFVAPHNPAVEMRSTRSAGD